MTSTQIYIPRLIPRNSDPTRRNLAYGKLTIPNLVRDLKKDNLQERQKILMSLAELFHKPEHIHEGIHCDVMNQLDTLLHTEDRTTRELVSEIYCTIASHGVGRSHILMLNTIPILVGLLDDPELSVRYNIHETFLRISSSSVSCADKLLKSHIVPELVKRLLNEVSVIQLLITQTLYYCIRRDPKDALANNAMDILTKILSKEDSSIKLKIQICRVIQALSLPINGKSDAVECNTIPALLSLLSEPDQALRAEAAGSLMSITIDIKAKKLVNKLGNKDLLHCLYDPNDDVRLNVVQTIANCAEDHQGRGFYMVNAIKQLKDLETNPNNTEKGEWIAKAASRAIKVIKWCP